MSISRWRWEYLLEVHDWEQKRWRLLVEDVSASVEIRTMREALDILGEAHPVMPGLREMFMSRARERIELVPWHPFEPSRELVECLGPHVVERMQAKTHDAKVWSSVDGWVWLHVHGDAATP